MYGLVFAWRHFRLQNDFLLLLNSLDVPNQASSYPRKQIVGYQLGAAAKGLRDFASQDLDQG
jgi:hypothetical protein